LPPTLAEVQVIVVPEMFEELLNPSTSFALSTPCTRNASTALPEDPLATNPNAAETSLSDLPILSRNVFSSGLELEELTKSLPFIDPLVTFTPPSVSGMSAASSLALLGRLKDGRSPLALAPVLGVGTGVGVGDGVGVAAPLLLAQAASITVSRPATADARKRFMRAISGVCGGPAAAGSRGSIPGCGRGAL